MNEEIKKAEPVEIPAEFKKDKPVKAKKEKPVKVDPCEKCKYDNGSSACISCVEFEGE